MKLGTNGLRGIVVASALGIFMGLMVGPVSRVYAGNPIPGAIPPHAKPYGMTYGEWSARWWQWALSLPVDQNPFFDEGGDCSNGANGQLGPIWFLTGVINASGTAVRNCTVPVGKALFFPVINVECSTLEAPPYYGGNEAELRACAKGFQFEDVFLEIDGVRVRDLTHYLVASPLFWFTVPPDNALGVPAGTGQSVSNGYFVMLTPRSAGKHVIHFGGAFTGSDPLFALDITYNLNVVPKRR
jgi:hypothetical protein